MTDSKGDFSHTTSDPTGEVRELAYERPDRMGFAGVVRIIGWSAIGLGGLCLFRVARELIELARIREIWRSPLSRDKIGLLLECGFFVVGVSLIRGGLQLMRLKSDAGIWLRRILSCFILIVSIEFLLYVSEFLVPGLQLGANVKLAWSWRSLDMIASFGIYRVEEALSALILLGMLSTVGLKEFIRETAPESSGNNL